MNLTRYYNNSYYRYSNNAINTFNSNTQETNNINYNRNPKENEMSPSQMKIKIFELEQDAKNYSLLENMYNKLQSENTVLFEDKLKLEFLYKQKNDDYMKLCADMKKQSESLNEKINNKLTTNRKLFNENSELKSVIEEKKEEIRKLKEELRKKELLIKETEYNRENLSSENSKLKEYINQTQSEILLKDKDNEELKRKLTQREMQISNLEKENSLYKNKILSLEEENENINNKIKCLSKNMSKLKEQLQSAHSDLSSRNMERITKIKEDGILNKDIMNKGNDKVRNSDNYIGDIEGEMKTIMSQLIKVNNDNNNMKMTIDKVCKKQEGLLKELEKHKSHIVVLTETNKELLDELENISENYDKVTNILKEDENFNPVIGNKNKGKHNKSSSFDIGNLFIKNKSFI